MLRRRAMSLLRRRYPLLMLAVAVSLGAAGCVRTQQTGSRAPECAPDDAPFQREPLIAEEVEPNGGHLPTFLGGLAALQQSISLPRGYQGPASRVRIRVEFVVDAAGCVRQARVTGSPDEVLQEATLDALRRSRWRPGNLAGAEVPVRMQVPITFHFYGSSR